MEELELDLDLEEHSVGNKFANSVFSLFTSTSPGYRYLINDGMKLALLTRDIECFSIYLLLRRFHIPCDLFIAVIELLEKEQKKIFYSQAKSIDESKNRDPKSFEGKVDSSDDLNTDKFCL